MTSVLKRDGSNVPFDRNKIVSAIKKAGFVRDDVVEKIVSHIEKTVLDKPETSIETIQDMVEDGLMKSSFKNVAKEYIRYRNTRERIRNTEKCNDSILRLIDSKNEYLKTENSNKNIKIASTQRDYIAGEVSKELTKRLLLPQEVVEAHEAGVIHFHN